MQFHLAPDELNLLSDILLSKTGAPYDKLSEMVLRHNLSFDAEELVTISDLLTEERRRLLESISRESDPMRRSRMQANLARLETLQDHVSEVCAMF
jgi:hypothetical protein